VKPRILLFIAASFLSLVPALCAQEGDPRQRTRTVRELAKMGPDAIPRLAPYVSDPDTSVRVETVKALVEIGGPKTVDALVRAAGDNDAEVQIRATDGLVNVYLPGYVKTGGISATLSRAGAAVRAKFTDTNDQVVDPFVKIPPEVITALGKLVKGGVAIESRTNAARGVGVLRGGAALPDLIDALRSKDDKLMYEALVAIQKIGDPSAAPRISFLLRDLQESIQVTALETTGLLRNKEAEPQVRDALQNARTVRVRRAALGALAMLEAPVDRTIFQTYLQDKDDLVRAAAAEGLGRLKNPADKALVQQAFTSERGMNPRLSAAFASVAMGELGTDRYGPLQYLINSLNQRAWRGVASAFLIELSRDPQIRQAFYPLLAAGTKDEKIQMAIILARAGDRDSVPSLETLSKDTDPDVAAEGIRSLRNLRARLP